MMDHHPRGYFSYLDLLALQSSLFWVLCEAACRDHSAQLLSDLFFFFMVLIF